MFASSFLLFVSFGLWGAEGKVFSILRKGPSKYQVVEGLHQSPPVYAVFNNDINETGLVALYVRTTAVRVEYSCDGSWWI